MCQCRFEVITICKCREDQVVEGDQVLKALVAWLAAQEPVLKRFKTKAAHVLKIVNSKIT